MQGLSGHIIRRLLFLPVILFVVSFGAFFITRWGPGDPVRIAAGSRGDTEAVQRVQEKYGLDEPIVVQYRIWVEDLLLHGDFGPTYVIFRDRDILTELIWPKMWVSIRVASYAFFQVKSMDEAIHWTARFLQVLGKGECELRPIFEPEDFSPEAFSPEERKREEATRQRMRRNAAK